MKKVAFYTLGCKLNFSETSTLARQIKAKGFQQVPFEGSPDVYVINTCSVTDNADRKCRKIVREALSHSPHAFIAIVGCYAQLKPQEIASIPGVDAVLGANEKFQLWDLLKDFKKEPQPRVMACDISEATEFHLAYSMDHRTRTFLKVQDGCDYSCAFCTIPLARGKSRSHTIARVVEEACRIGRSGVKEIVLTGVNVGDFGIIDGKRQERFEDLVKSLEDVREIERIRISSIEPNLLTAGIVAHVANSQKFQPHFHIPLQSGSDKVLRSMKRRYLTGLYQEKVQSIKEAMPYSCIGSDVIVGFPDESDSLFKETYQFLVDLPNDYLHVFTYSERPNTLAATMHQVVPKSKRAERSKMLRILSDKKRRLFYQRCLGQERPVLFEDDVVDDQIMGYTDNYIRVAVPQDAVVVNQISMVRLQEVKGSKLVIGKVKESLFV